MSRAYYYLSASLPILLWGEKPPMNKEDFLSNAVAHLDPRDWEVLTSATLVPERLPGSSHTAVEEWYRYETALRNEIVNLRGRKEKRDPEKYFRGEYDFDFFLADLVVEVASEESPLEMEREIDLRRWAKLDEIGLNHFFDLTFLTIYYLKLQLLVKWNRVKIPDGERILGRLLPGEEEAEK